MAQETSTDSKKLASELESINLDSGSPILGSQDKPQDSLHGEWMVVTRSKKSAYHNGKGKNQTKGSIQSGFSGDNGKAPKKVSSQPLNVGTQNVVTQIGPNSVQKEPLIFTSSALTSTSSPNARKKRHRVDPQSSLPLMYKSSQMMVGLPQVQAWLMGGRMRFRDQDDPPNQSSAEALVEGEVQGRDMDSDAIIDSSDGSLVQK
ncbi:hypothetical protein SESBI_14191 [Sesbania bispinosa]|nr:hypothetical protein SESBI_14191 [Sesbania bispinosa]